MKYELTAQARPADMTLEQMRANDLIPAVVYGKGIETQSIVVERVATIEAYQALKEEGELTIMTPVSKAMTVKFKAIQIDPVSHKLLHVDFVVSA